MPNDALNYSALIVELNKNLVGGRLTKAIMPSRDSLVLTIHNNRQSYCLLLSANIASSRCHITKSAHSNMDSPPAFLTHIKKHLSGSRLANVRQIPFERVMHFDFDAKSELGYTMQYSLILEIHGAKSNIILTMDNGLITDSLRHISLDTDCNRPILPRVQYQPPPIQNKLAPNDLDGITSLVIDCEDSDIPRYLSKRIFGLAPQSILEAVFRACSANEIAKEIVALQSRTNTPYPCIVTNSGRIIDFGAFEYKHYGQELIGTSTLSDAMDRFYTQSATTDNELKNKIATLSKRLQAIKQRLIRNINIYLDQIKAGNNVEHDKLLGELITSNIYQIKAGQPSIEVINYYDPECKSITIPLDIRLSPAQNAQKCYARFGKKKRGIVQAERLLVETRQSLDSLDTIMYNLSIVTTSEELKELKEEIIQAGLDIEPKSKSKPKGKTKAVPSAPIKVEVDGYTVLIGKNSAQNDRLSRNMSPNDIWLHALKVTGSHVIIKNPNTTEPPIDVIKKAASYAAFYSSNKDNPTVSVDYTSAKFVSRPSGGALGKVTYSNQTTLLIAPKDPVSDISNQ